MSVVRIEAFKGFKIAHALSALKAGMSYAYLGRRLRYAQPLPQAKGFLAFSQRSPRPKYSTDKQHILNFASILQPRPLQLLLSHFIS